MRFDSQPSRDHGATPTWGLDDQHTNTQSGNNAIATRELTWTRRPIDRKFTQDRTASFDDFSEQRPVLKRIGMPKAAPQDDNRATS